MTACKNCGNQFEGNYCNNCGQTADTHRFTIKEIIHNFFHTFTHADRGLLRLIPDLFTKPGETVRNYIGGQRKKYFNPIQFLLIMTAITTFIIIQFHMMGTTSVANPERLSNMQLFFIKYNAVFYKYTNILNLLSTPLFAFITWMFFRKKGFNYAENLIMQVFYAAQRGVIYVLFAFPLALIFPRYIPIIMPVYTLLWFLYFYYGFIKFFEFKGTWDYIKGFLSIIIFYVLHFSIMYLIIRLFFW